MVQSSPNPLTWGLVIATYQREKILPLCIQLALGQTRKPSEIIIVDASSYWETTRDTLVADFFNSEPDISWQYIQAQKASLTVQRNQGIQLASADILFLIDDDSLMYPDCAEQIMKVYEQDVEQLVKGVQAFSKVPPPPQLNLDEIAEQSRADSNSAQPQKNQSGLKNKLKALKLFPGKGFNTFFSDRILLNKPGVVFIPYDGHFHQSELPKSIEKLNIQPISVMVGFKMTYRREAILAENFFEDLFLAYSALEDCDASYRVSRQGLLVEAQDAQLHHFKGASGIITGTRKLAITLLNQALLLRQHSSCNIGIIFQFYLSILRRLFAGILKLILFRKPIIEDFKGIVLGTVLASRVLFTSENNLQSLYSSLQRQVLQVSN